MGNQARLFAALFQINVVEFSGQQWLPVVQTATETAEIY